MKVPLLTWAFPALSGALIWGSLLWLWLLLLLMLWLLFCLSCLAFLFVVGVPTSNVVGFCNASWFCLCYKEVVCCCVLPIFSVFECGSSSFPLSSVALGVLVVAFYDGLVPLAAQDAQQIWRNN